MKSLSLQEIRKSQIETMCIFRNFCQKNNLKYYIACGTLLGAVRHKGYIPWDDDVDVYMPRNDYDFLIKHFNNVIDNDRKIISKEISQEFWCDFAKLYDQNTLFFEKGQNIHIGVCVDIFPLEYMKEDAKHKIFNNFYVALIGIIVYCISLNPEKNRAIYKNIIIKFLNWLFPSKDKMICKHKKLIDNMKSTVETDTYGLTYRSFGIWGVPMAAKNMFEPSKQLEFEGEIFDAPNKYKDILTFLYGSNYMKLPPKDKRYCHNYICYWNEENRV